MDTRFKNKLKYLSLLNAIIEPEWEYRYYSYNSSWSENEEMSSLRDSCGGEWFIWFSEHLAAFKCTSPEDGLSNIFPRIIEQVPEKYASFINEPVFSMKQGSAIWYLSSALWVKLGEEVNGLPTPDTINVMLPFDPCAFVEEVYEQELDSVIVENVFNGNFKIEMAVQINPDIDLSALKDDIREIGISI